MEKPRGLISMLLFVPLLASHVNPLGQLHHLLEKVNGG